MLWFRPHGQLLYSKTVLVQLQPFPGNEPPTNLQSPTLRPQVILSVVDLPGVQEVCDENRMFIWFKDFHQLGGQTEINSKLCKSHFQHCWFLA